MDNFDNLIEKYRRELMEFSKNNPASEETVEASAEFKEGAIPTASMNINIKDETVEYEKISEKSEEIEAISTATEPTEKAVEPTQSSNYVAPQFADYNEFLKNNPQSGSLKVQVFAADQAFPIPNARITIVLELLNGPREMYDGLTDMNGIIDNIKLPAPDAEMSQEPSSTQALPYSTYTTYVEHPDFVNEKFTNVPVFPGIKSIQGVELISRVNTGNQPESVVQNEGELFTRLKGVK